MNSTITLLLFDSINQINQSKIQNTKDSEVKMKKGSRMNTLCREIEELLCGKVAQQTNEHVMPPPAEAGEAGTGETAVPTKN